MMPSPIQLLQLTFKSVHVEIDPKPPIANVSFGEQRTTAPSVTVTRIGERGISKHYPRMTRRTLAQSRRGLAPPKFRTRRRWRARRTPGSPR